MASLVAIAALVGCSKSDDNGGISISEGTFPKKIVNKGSNGNVTNETIYNLQGGKILSTTSISYKPDGSIESKSLISASYEGDYPKEITHTESITMEKKRTIPKLILLWMETKKHYAKTTIRILEQQQLLLIATIMMENWLRFLLKNHVNQV